MEERGLTISRKQTEYLGGGAMNNKLQRSINRERQ